MSTTTRTQPRAHSGPDGDDGEGPAPERVTVNLSAVSAAALNLLTKLTGTNKTDSINKALQFYAMIKELISNGGAVYIREPGEKDLEKIKIF